MSLIVAENLSKSFSEVAVLRNVKLTLAPLRRVGLVGPNGQGKTTLLRILAGLEPPTDGHLQRKSDLRIGYLPQDPPALEGESLREALLSVFDDLRRLERDMHALAHELETDSDDRKLARYGDLSHEFETRGGYSYAQRVEQVLEGLRFETESWDRPLAKLSGGQRTRAYLAKLLLQDPEVLLLDEPTNHLDYEAVEWLEEWLRAFHGSLVVVSHDRWFLDRVTTATWEVSDATLECYKGAYTDYLAQREERFKERMRRWEAQQQYIRETEDFIRRFIAGQRTKEAQGRQTRLERFLRTEAIAQPREHPRINVRFRAGDRAGDIVLRITDLRAGYAPDKPLVTVEELEILRGRRIAVVGPNGAGKTTLVRTILGQLPALAGEIKLGSNVQPGYLSQTHAELDPDDQAFGAVLRIDPAIGEQRARNVLGSLLLTGDDSLKKIRELSGGQRSRVALARLIFQRPNLLVMDEPTNHLDILSQEVLQDVLSDFDGTILFVSHDRYLIHALATDIWAIHDGTITPLVGDWDRYLEWRDKKRAADPATQPKPDKQQRREAQQQRKEDQKERRKQANELKKTQRRFDEVETQIHQLEAKLEDLNEQISHASGEGDMKQIEELGHAYTAEKTQLQTLYKEWEQLGAALEDS
ncbi:MAG: ABC-F family ATP-binding cassette domain-containing protein [Phycisphaerae bacterium]|nr:ABC-F family ATP-binding cassette domain-containing protein [Phycisphaerae bacterium]